MKMLKLMLLTIAASVAGAAFAQDKPNVPQEQPNQAKASASLKLRPAGTARAATGIKAGQQQDQQDRRERAEKVAAGLQKKANETASAAASNVK